MGYLSLPKSFPVFPLKPWPTQPKHRRKFFHMKHPKAPKYFGATHGFPINLAFYSGSCVMCFQNESSLHFVDVFHSAQQDEERRQMVNGLGCQNRLDKGDPAGHSNKLAIPCGKFTNAFIFKMLKISSPEARI
jgi:hypothetical protein